MAKTNVPTEIINTVSQYGKLLKDKGLLIDKIFLFGSYAKNLYRPSSDIDVCVVSSEFIDEHSAQVILGKLTWNLDTRIEPHPILLSDFIKNDTPFINEVYKNGIFIPIR